jgi:hypothetical protein
LIVDSFQDVPGGIRRDPWSSWMRRTVIDLLASDASAELQIPIVQQKDRPAAAQASRFLSSAIRIHF